MRRLSDVRAPLGLYIVREIVKAHGGSVSADSNGDATVFSVRL
jgi:signal transduction histidine kinase